MKNETSLILKKILEKINPEENKIKIIKNEVSQFVKEVKIQIKKQKINAEVFIGGSFAKNTIIKKDVYDVDIFIRFDKKYINNNLTELTNKLLKNIKNKKKIHGSRDYFNIKITDFFYLEIVPVIKIKNPKEAQNITDFSYSHVNYVNKKIKSQKIIDEIKIMKTFCQANDFYGAESYIRGFSGYTTELLIIYYKTFLNLLKNLSKENKEKIIIDIENFYKDKNSVLMNLNESKLESPIILIDPTNKYRNALAALSNETFSKFKEEAKKFLKNPKIEFFEKKKIDLKKIKENALKKKQEFILMIISTKKQEGDIAGSKLLKFYNHLCLEINRFFEIKEKGFNYNNQKSAKIFLVVKKRNEIILEGPLIKDIKNLNKFKERHKNTFEKKGRIYAQEKFKLDLNQFVDSWKNKNKRKILEMNISEMKISGD
ncbi:MAG: nucleotidyltransferase domain-containing protein [Candidatus Pacearchaeota archaeon]|jgi:tRNA nucleotidyltransferase (CCA-adding enzyme)